MRNAPSSPNFAETIPGLATATFPTSTHSPSAAHELIGGLLLLHFFAYGDASSSFVAAEKVDPGFAMAYWAEAMTFSHPVWNQLDVQAALAKFGPTPEARAQRIGDEQGLVRNLHPGYSSLWPGNTSR